MQNAAFLFLNYSFIHEYIYIIRALAVCTSELSSGYKIIKKKMYTSGIKYVVKRMLRT